MDFITKEEIDKRDLISKINIVDGNFKLDGDFEYKTNFEIGDIVAYKNNNDRVGVISFVEEEEITVTWADNSETTETLSALVIVPPTVGVKLLNGSSILNLWEELSNGKSDNFDLKCIYLKDVVINEVPFIRAFKNTTTLVDTKFKRNFTLYRKFGNSQIFRTNLYTISNDKVDLDTSRYVYYLLENNVVYYLGIDLDKNDLAVYLFNR